MVWKYVVLNLSLIINFFATNDWCFMASANLRLEPKMFVTLQPRAIQRGANNSPSSSSCHSPPKWWASLRNTSLENEVPKLLNRKSGCRYCLPRLRENLVCICCRYCLPRLRGNLVCIRCRYCLPRLRENLVCIRSSRTTLPPAVARSRSHVSHPWISLCVLSLTCFHFIFSSFFFVSWMNMYEELYARITRGL